MRRRLLLVVLAACGGARPADPRAAELAPAVVKPVPMAVEPGSVAQADRDLGIEVVLTDFTICVRLDGRVYCGLGDKPLVETRLELDGVDDAVSVGASRNVTCAVQRSGTIRCKGDNSSGMLGARLRAPRTDAPTLVAGVADAKRVVASNTHACALTGGLVCWGPNYFGETSGAAHYQPDARELVEPVAVPVPSPIAVGVTGDATCAITSKREVWCWGTSKLGSQETAQGKTNEHPWHATELDGLEDVAGTESVFCGVRQGGVICWGNSYSLFPDFRGDAREPRAVEVPNARRVRVASNHACALTRDGRVFCWGASASRALGREMPDDSSTHAPAVVEGLPRAVDIAVGGSMACAIVDGGDVYCWGRWPTGERPPARIEPVPVKLRVRD